MPLRPFQSQTQLSSLFEGLTGQRAGELSALSGRLAKEKEVVSFELKTVCPSDKGIHQPRRQINLPCALEAQWNWRVTPSFTKVPARYRRPNNELLY